MTHAYTTISNIVIDIHHELTLYLVQNIINEF